MKNVSILVPESSVMQAIADPQYLFSAVNQFLQVSGREPLFNVQLVGAKKEVKLNNGMFSVHTDAQIKDVEKTDLVFIPALGSFLTADLLGGAKQLMIGNLVQNQFSAARNWPFGSAASFIIMALVLAAVMLYLRKEDPGGHEPR